MSDYLPQEIIVKILTRLPPKSIIKCRCVSKTWNSLITNPYFVSLHMNEQTSLTNTTNDQVLVRRYSKAHNSEVYSLHVDDESLFDERHASMIEYPFQDDPMFYYRIVGSCKGLLCLCDDLFGYMGALLLWNPVIKRKLVLSPADLDSSKMDFDMSVHGFGYDAVNNDFKVVRMKYLLGNYEYVVPPKVDVYALSRGSWCEFEGELPRSCVVEFFWTQVLVNGSVHWLAYKHESYLKKLHNLIMVFDMSLDVFSEMQLPDVLANNELPMNLTTTLLADCFAVFQHDVRVWTNSCNIWVMKEYGNVESWSKQFHVRPEGGIGLVLGFRRNGEVLMTSWKGGLFSCHPQTGARKDFEIGGTQKSFYVGPYTESLALLIEGAEARERIPSDSESDGSDMELDSDSSFEEYRNEMGNVDKRELRRQTLIAQYFAIVHDQSFA